MAWTKRPLLEKMTLFWHGFFTTSFRMIGVNTLRMIIQNHLLREYAFDTFDNLLLAITSDPAMLSYLNLNTSKKERPNENYARELLELFTLGVGHYTQEDVQQAAAALTGWHHIPYGITSYYSQGDHCDSSKRFLGHTGPFDYKDILHILANHPATPWFLCHRLFTFFIHEHPSQEELRSLVTTYEECGHKIGVVMHHLLVSPTFSTEQAYRSKIKSPVEYVVGSYHALDVQGNGEGLENVTTMMGQTAFDPPNVAGWPGDKTSASWLNSGTWIARVNYMDHLLSGRYRDTAGLRDFVDVQAIINANDISSPEHFVDYFASFLLDGALQEESKASLVHYFLARESNEREKSPARVLLTNGQDYPLHRVRGTLYLMLVSPAYQLN